MLSAISRLLHRVGHCGDIWKLEEISFTVKHPPRTLILVYRAVQQLGAVQSWVSWLEADT